METSVLRRDILSALAALPWAFGAELSIADPTQGPHFYQVSRKNGRVFLLGFGEATDDSWFSPSLQKALDDSSSLWLENGNQGTATAETKSKIERLGHQSRGRTFFDELEPRVRDRTATYMRELGIQADALEGVRPWRAYYAIVNAFYANRRPSGIPLLPDKMLAERSAAGRPDANPNAGALPGDATATKRVVGKKDQCAPDHRTDALCRCWQSPRDGT